MLPITDIKGEHTAFTIILNGMKKIVNDIHKSDQVDLYRVGHIIDFLRIYAEKCHYEKEEKGIFPVLLESAPPRIVKMINQLVNEHTIARGIIKELNDNLFEYLSGRNLSMKSIAKNLSDFVKLEEDHMKKEDIIILPLFEKLYDKKKFVTISSDFKLIQDQQVGHIKQLEYYRLLMKLNTENNFPGIIN
jgi:hemerythrin-like domain-containing protein